MPTHYERLSALDATFLELEHAAPNAHMHVAATLLFDAGPLQTPAGGLDMERIRAYIASRLHLVPRYRQRLAYIPLEGQPVWVDDQHYNLFYHVRHTALPRPGEERQLKRLCGRIFSQKLDETKPLWEMWVVEGVEGNRFALVAKAHHAMVDGIAGMDLLTVLLSPAPLTTFDPAPPWCPRPAPGRVGLILGEARRRTMGALAAARAGAQALAAPLRFARTVWQDAAGILAALAPGVVPASPTVLNPAIGPHRRFDWLRLDLDAVKAVKHGLGGTVNDVVLAMVIGAARRFLLARGARLEGLDFRALVPVNVRPPDQRGQLGNRLVNFIVHLPVDEHDAKRRHARVVGETARQKHSHVVQGAEVIEELADWTVTAVLSEVLRLAIRNRAYNIVVTNVPGPQLPLFLLEAPLREPYPMVPLFENQAVGVAIFSYAGGLFLGINADWDAVPDLHDFTLALREEFDELHRLAGREAAA